MIRLLHTADVHLGRQFPSLGSKAGEYRSQLLRTFEKISDLAVSEKVSLLLIAGDLFDSNRVYGLTVGKVLSAFQKLGQAGIQVCILPGTHDAYSEDSIYRSMRFPSNVTVFTPENRQWAYPELDVTVYGLLPQSEAMGKSPLEGFTPNGKSVFHIGMAHGSVKRPGIENDAVMLTPEEFERSGLGYLALGHWHSFQDLSRGSTTVCYSGSPEPINMDQKGAGNVVMVTLREGGKAEFEPVAVGSKKCDSITLDISPFESSGAVAQAIEAHADSNLILEVVLSGMSQLEEGLDGEELVQALGGRFFDLRIVDNVSAMPEEIKSRNYPDKTVVGRYLGIMEEKIAAAPLGEDKSLYEEALKLGFALLQGRSQVLE